MRLVMVGGGGFRTPLVYRALCRAETIPVEEVVLLDTDPDRVAVMARILNQISEESPGPSVRTAEGEAGLDGADVVFSAIRVGGLAGRVADERVALGLGVLGQETTGAGGLAYGLRTVPVADRLAAAIARRAPGAWTINFTNPAGLITQAMRDRLGDRVVGICDSPVALARRCAAALGRDLASLRIDYAGLNHLGWLHGLWDGPANLLDELLAHPERLGFEEGRLFGADWVRTLGAIPNEYLYYYYFTREALAGIAGGPTRGEFLRDQQSAFYAAVRDDLRPLAAWERVHRERDESYLAEARPAGQARDEADLAGGGYEGVALDIIRAIAEDRPADVVVNVPNAGTLPGLPDDAVVEVPCRVDASGFAPRPVTPLAGHRLGLVQQVKECERLVIEAARTGSVAAAVEAFAVHPLVDSVIVARQLLNGYRAAIPEVAAVFQRG